MITYTFNQPITIKAADKADPQKIGEALALLAGDEGDLTPTMVVTAAKNRNHILHRHFEWDDSVAANAYRLDQARGIIRSIVANDEDQDDEPARAFISITEKDGTSYRTLGAIRESADLQAKVLEQAERDLEAWKKRYKALKDVCAIVVKAQEMLAKKLAKERAKRQSDDSRPSA